MVTQADPNLNISKTGLEANFFILEKRSFKNRPDLLLESSENNLPNEKPFETLYHAFETYKRLVLLGEPGAGKTVALQEFKKNISKKERQAENNSLVIFVSIQKWKYPADIVTFLAKEIGKTEEDFRKEIQTKRLLLLLDGLDELPSNVSKRSESRDAEIIDYRVHFLSKLSDFFRNLNPNNISIVMTCRKRDYEEIRRKIQEEKKDFKNIFHGLVVLKRLKNDEIKTYLKEINQKKLNNYLNGEKHGKYSVYFAPGQLKEQLTYDAGIIKGDNYLYYKDGKVQHHFHFNAKGERHGVWEKFHPNGNPKEYLVFKNGQLVAPIKRYDLNGNLLSYNSSK